MRRHETSRVWIMLAASGAALVLILWGLAIVAPSPSDDSPPALRETPAPSKGPASAAPSQDNPTHDEAGAGAEDSSPAGATPSRALVPDAEPQSLSQPDTIPASFSTAARASPPAGRDDLAPDGLPASALRCAWDGGVLKCGSCWTDSDCPRGQGCVPDWKTRRFKCVSSECEEDTHCFPGFVCRTVSTGITDTVIRRCVPEGVQQEGEACAAVTSSRRSTCREGLRCVDQMCTAPCQLDVPTSCPSGYTCTDGPDGPGCVPDCQKLGCPQGQQCKHLKGSDYTCLERVTGTCPESSCAEGERCNVNLFRGHGTFWCARVCNPLRPDSCPSGQVCGKASGTASTCYRQCDPRDLDFCGPGWMCATVSEDFSLWGCSPAVDP